MNHKRFIAAICAAAVLTLSACGTTNTVSSTEMPSPPASDVPVPEVSDTSVLPDSNSDAVEMDTEKESQGTEQENVSLPPQAPEVPARSEGNAPASIEPNPLESISEEHTKILIAYFTWAENTVVDDPSSVDVDATTSASVLVPGHAAQMAGWILRSVRRGPPWRHGWPVWNTDN